MHEPIAIVGMACRFPGQVTDTDKLWEFMIEARNAHTEVPAERFNQDTFYHPDSKNNGTFNARGGHFLHEDVSRFDATFFNIAPAEAKAMDPQLRILLEVSYEALENGGYTLDRIRGSNTGVYTALYNRDYEKMMFRDPEHLPFYAVTGNGEAMFSNRLSYFFDLKGPSFTLDSGCSGSLVALHNACTGLWTGESQQSIVAASNLILDPMAMIGPSFMQFLSKDGHSYSFDSRGCGYGRGEGTACVILKPLSKAMSDGDNIRSIIRSCVTNQDGRTQGITMPNLNAQEALIEKAYSAAACNPRDTVYVEAHGSGTAAGDYAESAALGAILGSKRPRYDPLLIGSIKTNIGHLENASGLAALIKATLIIEKECIPPNTNFESPNPSINFNQWNLKVATTAQPLTHTASRQVSVSSFGYGGTNVHAILDKPPTQSGTELEDVRRLCRDGDEPPPSYLFIFAARSKASSSLIADRLQEYLSRKQYPSPGLIRSLAHTLCNGRSQFQWRHALVADSVDELQSSLQSKSPFHHSTTTPELCFIFTGQGSQWYGMGKELFQSSSIFRESILAAERQLLCLGAEWRLTDELLKSSPGASLLDKAQVAQPACTAIQLALVNLLSSWKVKPDSVAGHSSGEIAAAYACDAISFNDALLAAHARGYWAADMASKRETSGGMLAVGLSEQDARGYLGQIDEQMGAVKVACINSPKSVTLSCDKAAIVELQELLQRDHVFVRRLPVDVAYHSHHMAQIAESYRNALTRMSKPSSNPSVSFFSSVEGRLVDTRILDRDYWVTNLVSPVLFSQAVNGWCQRFSPENSAAPVLIEVGPHAGLKGPLRQCLEGRHEITSFHYSSMLVRSQSARKTALSAAGELFVRGCDVDLDAVNFDSARDRPQILADLPPYPWHHSTSYWHEGRLSRNYRTRHQAPHDMLGVPAPDSSIFEPRWRKYIRLPEMPWLEGHKVQSRVIFPAAGWLSMAFEAGARYFMQSTSEASKIACITLSEVSFAQPLILSDPDESVEVMFVLRPSGNYNGRDLSHRHEFIAYSFVDTTKVVEHSRGFVAISSKHAPSAPAELDCESSAMADILPSKFYEEVQRSCGLEYSGCFSGISSILAGAGSSQTTITTSKVPQSPYNQPWGTSFHPATLDACMQSLLPAILAEPGKKKPLILSAIKEVTLIPHSPKAGTEVQDKYNVTCRVTRQRKDAYGGSLSMESSGQNALVLSMSSVVMSEMEGVSRSTASSQSATQAQKVVKYLDPILLSVKDTELICYATTDEDSMGTELNAYTRACHIFARSCLDQLQEKDLQRLQPFHVKYLEWLKGVASQQINNPHLGSDNEAAFLASIERKGSIGKGICQIGRSLPQIMRGEKDALALLMSDGLLQGLYREDPGMQRCSSHAAEYARLLGLKNPNLRILEIGAGTGSATLPILNALTGGKKNLFHHYMFTDISSGFFPKAMEKFSKWKDNMSFQALNIEEAPEIQHFDLKSYDLIIAANVLHATANIKRTMGHVRSLLKPGGSLLLVESTKPTAYRSFIFGTLPGWWLGSSERTGDGPLLTVEEWDRHMKETGFGGAEVCTHAYKQLDEQIDSFLISHAVPEMASPSNSSILLVLSERQFHGRDGGFARQLAVTIAEALSIQEDSIICLGNARASGKTCICLAGLEETVLVSCTESNFMSIKDTLQNAKTIIWVTRGATDACPVPDSSLSIGLLRVCRRENASTRAIAVDLDADGNRSVGAAAMCLLRFIERLHLSAGDQEWIERGGQWFLPRLVTDDLVSNVLSNDNYASSFQTLQTKALRDATRPLRLAVGHSRTLQDIHFVEDISLDHPLPDDEVELRVRATGINFRDPLIMLGVLDSALVGECSGVILKVGKNWNHRFRPGDRVYTSCIVAHATRVRAKGSLTHPIPHSLSFADAAAIPLVYATVYYSLVTCAGLKQGESILIHAGAGGVGQAAIVLAEHIGAVIYTTVGSQEKKLMLIERYRIPEDHIFSSRDAGFVPAIQKATKGAGVDVVLNSLTGHLLQGSMEVLAVFGRFVELGKSDASSHARMDMSVFTKPVTFTSVDLFALSISRPQDMVELQASVHKLVEQGIFTPPSPVQQYPVSQVEDAFRRLQTGRHMGKSVLIYEDDSTVKVAPRTLRHTGFETDASYLLIGGQGGLGREICLWMAKNGAKHLVVLSPSGATKPTVRALQDDLAKMGTQLHAMACDVGDADQLRSALSVCRSELPPIRGVMFAAVSLRDTVFQDMSCKDYLHVLDSKMVGLARLHHALQQESLDFFIILSSYSGLTGNPGQANYAAASTYQDAFARWRTSQGLPTRAIDLGIIKGAGYVHENPASTRHLQKSGTDAVPLAALLQLLEYAVCYPPGNPTSSQIAIGWKPGCNLDASVNRPLFSHLISAESGPSKERASASTSPDGLLRTALDTAKSKKECFPQIEGAISHYLSNALGVPIEDVDPLRSMSHHGGDSLVLVEFRNWIEKGMGSPLGTGKDLGQIPLRELAQLMANSVEKEKQPVQRPPPEEKSCKSSGLMSPSSCPSMEMPTLPLPSLEKTIERYIRTVRPLVSVDKWLATSQAAKELLRPNGIGVELQQQLQNKRDDPAIRNWLDGIYAEARYLRDRRPLIPYSSFFGIHDAKSLGSSHISSPAVVAAIISSSAFHFKQQYEKGELPCDIFYDRAVCMEGYKWIFNACRIPSVGQDSREKYDSRCHLVAMRNGNAFKIPLLLGGIPASVDGLTLAFQRVIQLADSMSRSPVGVLTNDYRDTWSKNREILQHLDDGNAASIRDIESSDFVVCLDSASPQTPEERVSQIWNATEQNRWHGKSIQFIICDNGVSGVIGEHSLIDGLPGRYLITHMQETLQNHPVCELNTDSTYPEPTFLPISMDKTLDSHAEALSKETVSRLRDFRVRIFEIEHYGSQSMRQNHYNPGAFANVVVQLAFHRLYGHPVPSVEAVSTSCYFQGRLDFCRVVTEDVVAFCRAMEDRSHELEKRRLLLKKAIATHVVNTTSARNGEGIDMHFLALMDVARASQRIPDLFMDPTFKYSRTNLVSMLSLNHHTSETGAFPMTEDGWRVGYLMEENSTRFTVLSQNPRLEELCGLLRQASLDVSNLLV